MSNNAIETLKIEIETIEKLQWLIKDRQTSVDCYLDLERVKSTKADLLRIKTETRVVAAEK